MYVKAAVIPVDAREKCGLITYGDAFSVAGKGTYAGNEVSADKNAYTDNEVSADKDGYTDKEAFGDKKSREMGMSAEAGLKKAGISGADFNDFQSDTRINRPGF